MRRMLRWGVLISLLLAIFSVAFASPPAQQGSPENLFQATLDEIRTDVENLADRVFPLAERPDNWNGNTDFTSDSMLADLFIDNELIADEIFGAGERPNGWIGVSSTVADIIARNIRHDLEISANAWIGEDLRPDDWVGGPLLTRCSQTVMNIIYLLDIAYNVRPQTPETVRDYCGSLAIEIDSDLIPSALGEVEEDDPDSQLLAVRGDLERLADEVLGVNQRPGGYIDNLDIESQSFRQDLTSDLELLANAIFDNDRPAGWITEIPDDRASALRSLRFNLELLADAARGVGNRPAGWQGVDRLPQCAPEVQSLARLVASVYNYEIPETQSSGRDYCTIIRASANYAAENPPPPEVLEEIAIEELALEFRAESRNAFTYDDAAATVYFGVMPWGTEFRAWYRNFSGSTMMFVSGEGFALYIDRRWTTMTEERFGTLPTLEGVIPLTFCDADWCNGPAPTPTPTGSGPLLDIINSGTEPARPVANVTADANTEGLQLVTWNNIRVNYLLFREDVGQVQVTLEICRESNQLVCEPVISVFDNQTQAAVPIVSQSAGLNVYQLPFGYSTRFVIEGATLFSRDIWLNDPSLVNTGQ